MLLVSQTVDGTLDIFCKSLPTARDNLQHAATSQELVLKGSSMDIVTDYKPFKPTFG